MTQAVEIARQNMSAEQFEAWVRMGQQICVYCGQPMRPCPKGPGADEPGFVGFYPCGCASKRVPKKNDTPSIGDIVTGLHTG